MPYLRLGGQDGKSTVNASLLKVSQYNIAASSSLRLTHTGNRFAWLIAVQGGVSNCYATYIFQGYGMGDIRDHIATLHQGSNVSAVVDGTAIKITNTTTDKDASVNVLTWLGDPPIV